MKHLAILLLFSFGLSLSSLGQEKTVPTKDEVRYKEIGYFGKGRLTAVVLTLISGPVAGHRIYLGTDPKVPFVYAVTLGGGLGLLPLIDLGFILFSKDLERLLDNPNVFIWNKSK